MSTVHQLDDAPVAWRSSVVDDAASTDRGDWAPVLRWSVCLAVAIGLLLWLGTGQLAAPPLLDLGAWGEWATTAAPSLVTATVLRLGALALAWYLAGVTSIAVVARALRAARLARLATAISIGPTRLLVQQVVGVGLATTVLATAVPAGPPAAGTADRVVMVAVPAPAEPAPRPDTPPTAAVGPDPVPPPGPPVPASGESVARGRADVPGAPAADVQVGVVRERRIEPGDHFWAIAAEEVAGHLGHPGSDAQVRAHWRALLAANLDRLVVSGNPDLLLPGQHVRLPDVDGAG